MPRKRLSAIEYTVLGIAWKRGPCTTYALMKELASSTSTYYKAKAGTAYPLVERLVKSGLLAPAESTGAKGEKLITPTEAGVAALREWLTSPIDLAEVAHTVDFIRLRVFYLGAATPEERASLIDNALSQLRSQLSACALAIESYEAMGDRFSALATLGVVKETQARIDWLTNIRIAATEGRVPN